MPQRGYARTAYNYQSGTAKRLACAAAVGIILCCPNVVGLRISSGLALRPGAPTLQGFGLGLVVGLANPNHSWRRENGLPTVMEAALTNTPFSQYVGYMRFLGQQ